MDEQPPHISQPPDRDGQVEQLAPKPPSLFRNYISLVGAAIVIASLVSVVLLFLIEITSAAENPYLGILTYIIFPSILIFGVLVVIVGMVLERRRRHRAKPSEISAYPRLDLNDPRSRRAFFVFMLVTFVFVSASAFGSYRGYEYTESVNFCGETCHTVMKPEFTAYQAGAHARVGCVGCHVGPGASWYVRSKLSGAYQLYSVTFKKYSRPITTPVHNLRPAQETCEQCHWPEKFFGAQLKVINHYGYDQDNTKRQLQMLIQVGGGSPATHLNQHLQLALRVVLIIAVVIDDLQLRAEKLLGPMTLLASLLGRAQVVNRSRDWPRVLLERHRIQLISAREFRSHVPARTRPHVTSNAADARVCARLVRRELRLHYRVTRLATEVHRFGVLVSAIAAKRAGRDEHERHQHEHEKRAP